MKSVQSKILLLILSCVMLSAIALGGAGFLNARSVVENDSTQIMNLQCTQKTQEMNEPIGNIMQAVDTIYHYIYREIDVDKMQNDREYLDRFLEKVRVILLNASENTEGAVTGYFRTSPELTDSKTGVFLVYNPKTKKYEDFRVTDLLKYSPDNLEYVGWYYLPVNNRKATWVPPYTNQDIHVKMISYVVPIFKEGKTIGVVGMDIEMKLLIDMVNSIKLYDNGYAFLVGEDGDIVYHKDYTDGIAVEDFDENLLQVKEILDLKKKKDILYEYEWKDRKMTMTAKKLRNNMLLYLTVPSKEINAPKNKLLFQMMVSLMVVLVISVILTIRITRLFLRPLKQLTEAAQKVSEGDLEVDIQCGSKDEIGVLAEIFQKTTRNLKQYIDYTNRLAYVDALTGVQNKMAYADRMKQVEFKIKNGTAEFAIAVMDINNLKRMNDTYGHEYGDMLISDAAAVMQKCFGNLAVYRIGGDEFSVILEGEDYKNYSKLILDFHELIAKFNTENVRYQEALQIACGIAEYIPGTDTSFHEVFARADKKMYENKAMLKEKEKQQSIQV